jgi:hypothetical protein
MKPESPGKGVIARMGKNQHLFSAILLAVILGLFYRDILFQGRTFLIETAAPGTMPHAGPYNYTGVSPGFVANDTGAIAWQIEPFNRFISRSIKTGDFPLWNPYAGLAGSPLLADGHTGPLEPLQFLFFFVPDSLWTWATDLQLLLRFWIAGFTCYLFARRQGIRVWGSISAGVLFMLSSYFVTYGNHPQIKTEVLLPLVLYGYDRLADSEDTLAFWICALSIGWAVTAAMPESTFFALLLGSLWYGYKVVLQWQKNNGLLQHAKNSVFRYTGSTILGFLISAAYLLPFLEFVLLSKSIHSPGTGSHSYALDVLPGLIFQVHSKFFLQIGFFAVFSMVFSWLNVRDWGKFRQQILFFSLYAVIFLLTLFGFPLTNWIRDLPVFDQLVIEKYSIPSIVFCFAILAGIVIDRAEHLAFSYLKLSLSLIVLLVIFVGIPGIRDLESLSNFSSDLEFIYPALGLIATISVMLYLLAFYQRRRAFSQFVVQLSFLIMIMLEPFFWGIRINRPERFDPFQIPPFVRYLYKKEDTRIFAPDGTLYPNISTAFELADIRWLNALIPQRAYDFSTTFIEPREPTTMRFTGTVLPVSDKMFSLLNVRYILRQNSIIKDVEQCAPSTTEEQPYLGRNTLNQLIFEQNQNKENFFPDLPLNINGSTRMSFFAQPPQRFNVNLLIPKEPSKLDFSIGLSPRSFLPEYGDGVIFKIILFDQENGRELFSKYIDPKNRPCDRKWFDESINLEEWAGKEIVLRFTTTGGSAGDVDHDWAYWGDIRLTPVSPSMKAGQETATKTAYDLVYQDQDVLIYENKDALPRAFVTYRVINVANFSDALTQLVNPSIHLKETAIVELLPTELEDRINQNDKQRQVADGRTKRIRSGQLEIEVNTEAPGLLVVLEQYYPGWSAYVDGKPTPVYAVDGTFRGVFLEAGEHMVEFKYRPLSFIIGGIISAVSLLTTIFLLIFYAKFQRKNHERFPVL